MLALAPSTLRAQEPPGEAPRLALDQLVEGALEKNPAVQAALRRVEALRRRVPQARTLPDPTVSLGWMGNVKPFGVMRDDVSSFRGVSATQEIPYPGKLKLRGQIADRESEAAWWEYEAVRRRVAADVKAAFYDYGYFRKAIEITGKNKTLLDKVAQIAVTRYQVGQGIQPDVLKAQVEVSKLEQRLTVLEQQAKTAAARLNTLLARDPEAPLGPPDGLEPTPLEHTLETLYQLARKNDTGVQRDERLIERSQLALHLARKEYYPDFGVGYNYWNRPLFRDMHGLTFSVKIPVFYRSKQREGVNEATLDLAGAERSREARLTELAFEVKEQFLAARASDELAKLYSQAIVPQSSLALESALSAYQVGKIDFLTLLENFVTVLDYEIGYYRELANYQIALARLEPLVGVELIRTRRMGP
jgi:outer membrane protein TolC